MSNNKGSRLPTNNNEDVQKMAAKPLLSYHGAIKAPNISDPIIFGISIVNVHSYKNKCTTSVKWGSVYNSASPLGCSA